MISMMIVVVDMDEDVIVNIDSFDSCGASLIREIEQTQTSDTNWSCKCKLHKNLSKTATLKKTKNWFLRPIIA